MSRTSTDRLSRRLDPRASELLELLECEDDELREIISAELRHLAEARAVSPFRLSR